MKILILLIMLTACADASIHEPIEPKATREYDPCTAWHLKDFVGKYCWKQCIKFRLWSDHTDPRNCKEWFLEAINMSDPVVHQWATDSKKSLKNPSK